MTHKFPKRYWLKNIFLEYDSYSGGPLVLEGAFYTKDALVDLVSLLKEFEEKAKQLGIIMLDKASIKGVSGGAVMAEREGEEYEMKADCIVNATGAFTAKTAKQIGAEPPPENEYIVEYRHIGWTDKKSVPLFEEVTQGKMSYFRIFQNDNKVTFAEVMGDRSKICFYAPELIRASPENPDEPFLQDSKK